MYELEQKTYFYVLLIIPVLIVAFLLLLLWQRKTRKQFADREMLIKLIPSRSTSKPMVKLLLIVLFFVSLTIALVNPKIGTKLKTVKREGVDIVFAIDVSKSMAAEDIAPSRIEKAKRLVFESIKQLAGDRIGIITYAAQAYPQLPITTDYSAANMFLSGVNTDMMSSQGTAIDQAIDMATTFYDNDQQTNRLLFIISDGEDHSGKDIKSIERATQAGIKIYTIGVGTTKGAPIPIKERNINRSYKKNKKGEVVITKLNHSMLEQIARRGKGKYIYGADTNEVKKFTKEILETTEKSEFETKQFSDYKMQFQWFIIGALLFLIIDIFVLERKTAWIQRLNLFNEKKNV